MGNKKLNIDPVAANSDIRHIGQAMDKLNDSLKSLKRLKNDASNMHGETGQAIVDQCDKLSKDIENLIKQLTQSQDCIQKAVDRYEAEDKELEGLIRKQ